MSDAHFLRVSLKTAYKVGDSVPIDIAPVSAKPNKTYIACYYLVDSPHRGRYQEEVIRPIKLLSELPDPVLIHTERPGHYRVVVFAFEAGVTPRVVRSYTVAFLVT